MNQLTGVIYMLVEEKDPKFKGSDSCFGIVPIVHVSKSFT